MFAFTPLHLQIMFKHFEKSEMQYRSIRKKGFLTKKNFQQLFTRVMMLKRNLNIVKIKIC